MINALYGIYGASGFGREVMPLAREALANMGQEQYKLVFIDDKLQGENININGHEVVSFEEFSAISATETYVALAIADSKVREVLFNQLEERGIIHWNVFALNIVLMDNVIIGENSILSPFVTFTSNINVGKSFQANIYSYVAHDCVIGDFVTFAPGVKCNGNVFIEDHVYIGTGAIIKQGRADRPLKIGKGAVIAAGAVVTKNIPPGVTVFGNPARVLSKESLRKDR